MKIIKRDGLAEEVSFDKILKRIQYLSEDLPKVDPVSIAQDVIKVLCDGITTKELDEEASRIAQDKALIHPDFGKLASRLLISNFHKNNIMAISEHYLIHKDTAKQNLYYYVSDLLYNNMFNGEKAPMINEHIYNYIKDNKDWLESIIDYQLDYSYDYFGFKVLEDGYLMKAHVNTHEGCKRIIVERPQHMLMRVAIAIAIDIPYEDKLLKNKLEENKLENKIENKVENTKFIVRFKFSEKQKQFIKELYSAFSNKYYTHATPTLFNAGTLKPQLSSCFLVAMPEDSLEGIMEFHKQCAFISKTAGGIGSHIHNIRARGSYIKGTGGVSNGIVPMLGVTAKLSKYVDQGGNKRPGSHAVYLEPWHPDFIQFLELKLKEGNDDERARNLFFAIWMPDRFMRDVEEGNMWYFMCPSVSTGLSDTYGEKFDELYDKYIEEKKYVKAIPARDLFRKILDIQIETGMPYILFKDACNKKSNFRNYSVIKSSNLCAEILIPSNKDETGVCNLASICLNKFVETNTICYKRKRYLTNVVDYVQEKTFNFAKLREIVALATRSLNRVIDINYYPTEQAKNSNMKHRPIGIGCQGLADVYAMMNYPFDSEEARKLNFQIFENIYYASLEESCNLAQKTFHYETFPQSPAAQGKLQFDLWLEDPDERLPYPLTLDWYSLKNRIMKYGLRNSLCVALMPTASTSNINGNNECFEPFASNIYLRTTKSGEFVVINKHLVNKLLEKNQWTLAVRNWLKHKNGQLTAIVEDPDCPVLVREYLDPLKNIYKTSYEISPLELIRQARDRGFFVDHTQSLNLFFTKATNEALSEAMFTSWRSGLKTGSYYIRSRPAVDAIKPTVGDGKECHSCSS